MDFSLFKDKACEALELFDELVEVEVGIVIPYVKALVELCLQVCEHRFHPILRPGEIEVFNICLGCQLANSR